MDISSWEFEEEADEEEEEEYPEAGELLYVRWEDGENNMYYYDVYPMTEDGAYIDSTIDFDLYENYYENCGGSDVTISASDENDYIFSYGCRLEFLYYTADGYGGEEEHHESDFPYYADSYYVSINAGAGDDTVEIGKYSHYTTINGGAGNDVISVSGYNNLIQYADGYGNDTVYGFHYNDTLQIDGGVYTKETVGNDVIVTVGDGKITLSGAAYLSTLNIDGTEINLTPVTLDNSAGATTLAADVVEVDATARTKGIKIIGNALDNTISGGSGNDKLYGGNGDDSILGGAGKDELYGQAGDDTLYGGAGNDTLSGGSGNDLFVYESGNDVITDYAAGDKISLGAAISSATVDGSDALLTVGKNTLTVKNGKGKELTLIDAAGNEYTTLIGGLVLTNSAGATTLASGVAEADASARTKAIKIVGNELDNSILGGKGNDKLYGGTGDDSLVGGAGKDYLYGQDGNDTLWGGLGNDSLWGGAGADVFIYADVEGDDVISDFDENDMLQITGDFTAAYSLTDNSIVFNTANGSVALKNFKTTTFNVNGDSYVLGLVKK